MGKRKKLYTISALFLVVVAFLLRIYGLDWDQGYHLHPDERFLTMVSSSLSLPAHIGDYMNPAVSSMNPYTHGHTFYVYGTLPQTLVKIAAVFFGYDNYQMVLYVGRVMSALSDTIAGLCILAIASIIGRWFRLSRVFALCAMGFYAISVFPIQQAHFFTVDAFVHMFSFTALLFCLRWLDTQNTRNLVLCGICLGCAVGSKLSGAYIGFLIGALILCSQKPLFSKKSLIHNSKALLLLGLVFYITLRIASPYMFASSFILNPSFSTQFASSVHQLVALSNPNTLYPPGVQWIDKGSLFPLQNIAFFGVGAAYFVLACVGCIATLVYLLKRWGNKEKRRVVFLCIAWMGLFLVWGSYAYAKTMRYFYFIYPYLACFAGLVIYALIKRKHYVFAMLLLIVSLVWPLSFVSIYQKEHTRVSASKWINQTIPAGSRISFEYWDDPLPLLLREGENRSYKGVQLNVFDKDTKEKMTQIQNQIKKTDYVILSSNRGWGSIGGIPKVYPLMSRWYEDLFSGKLGFKKIKEFTSYPTFPLCHVIKDLCFVFDDTDAEEAFTVYDHPKVMIFTQQ